jgi:hypothetical protein
MSEPLSSSPEPHASSIMNWAFPLRMKMGQKFMYDSVRMIVKVSPWSLIKGPCEEQELEALLFVASHTTIPCPKIYRTYRRSNGLFIEMEFIQGTNLETAWEAGVPEATKQNVGDSIRGFVEQLRALEPPKDFAVGSSQGRQLKDGRISFNPIPSFKTIAEFHSFLESGLSPSESSELNEKHGDCQQVYRTYFSHADICARNFILKDDGSLVWIDWEFAGWWPEYWEYTKCYFAVFKELPGWLELMEQSLPVYSAELKKERALWRLPKPPNGLPPGVVAD